MISSIFALLFLALLGIAAAAVPPQRSRDAVDQVANPTPTATPSTAAKGVSAPRRHKTSAVAVKSAPLRRLTSRRGHDGRGKSGRGGRNSRRRSCKIINDEEYRKKCEKNESNDKRLEIGFGVLAGVTALVLVGCFCWGRSAN